MGVQTKFSFMIFSLLYYTCNNIKIGKYNKLQYSVIEIIKEQRIFYLKRICKRWMILQNIKYYIFIGVFLDKISVNETKELIDNSLNLSLESLPISYELIFKTIEENNTLDVRDKC